jgi:hypothetical protein
MSDDDTCGDCGQPVRWVITERGRRIEIDPDPADDGNVVPIVVDGHTRARILTGDDLPAEGPAYRRHASTCPESVEARKRKARNSPRCRVCLLPMDPELARLEQWREHPACDTTEGANSVRAALHREAS